MLGIEEGSFESVILGPATGQGIQNMVNTLKSRKSKIGLGVYGTALQNCLALLI